MRAILILISILFNSVALGDAVDNYISSFDTQQKNLLKQFTYSLVNSSAGYVLFGDKPMSIEVCSLPDIHSLSSLDQNRAALLKGKEMWDGMGLSSSDKSYILLSFELDQQCTFICINRKAFIRKVEENLPLFQYVLGPKLVPEKLLSSLISAQSQFYEVLQNNQVLLEILLGNGSQNAIANTRLTKITNPYESGSEEEFPYLSKKLSRVWTYGSNKFNLPPSFGFASLDDEEQKLHQSRESSVQLRSFQTCQIPTFSCLTQTDETKRLISLYEKNRENLLETIHKRNYLEETLRRLFTTLSGSIEIPKPPKKLFLRTIVSHEKTLKSLVQIIHHVASQEQFGSQKFLKSFIRGVTAREMEDSFPVASRQRRSKRIESIQRQLESCKNLKRADAYFAKLSARKDLHTLVPEQVYYKVLKPGKGNVATSHAKKFTFQFANQILGDTHSRNWGVVKEENLDYLIPGVAHVLAEMRIGEERVVYIHPNYAYGEQSFLPPNACFAMQVRLLDFEESDHESNIFPPHQSKKRDYKELLSKYEVLKSEEFFNDGVEFWDNIKRSGNFFDFSKFYDTFNNINSQKQEVPLDKSHISNFISDMEYLFLSLQNKI